MTDTVTVDPFGTEPGADRPTVTPRRRPDGWKMAFVTLLVIGVVGAAVWVLLGSRLLVVRQVEVVGQRLVPKDRVLAVAQVRLGAPLVRLDTGAIRSRVQAVQEIESARVERHWPTTVRIVVRERTPVVEVTRDGRYLQIDRYGVTVITSATRPARLPALVVASPAPGDPATRAALAVWRSLPTELRRRLATIEATSPEAVTLRLAAGHTIIWGAPERAEEKLRLLRTLLDVSTARGTKTIDVSSPEVVTTE